MPDLHHELELLAADVEFPPTPELRVARPRALPRRTVLALAAALVLLLAAAAYALDVFHLRGETVERTRTLPQVAPAPPQFGGRVSLAEAQKQVGFHVLVPSGFGAPREVFVKSASPVGEVTLTYRRPHRLIVTEFRGAADPDYAGKIAGPATSVKRLRVDGYRAIWISGAPHFFFYRSPNGTQRFETMRLAGNVLLLERGPLLIRLEGPRSEREAVVVAESLR